MTNKDNLDPISTTLVSNGSLIGIGIGSLITNLVHTSLLGIIISSLILILGIDAMRRNWYLMKKD